MFTVEINNILMVFFIIASDRRYTVSLRRDVGVAVFHNIFRIVRFTQRTTFVHNERLPQRIVQGLVAAPPTRIYINKTCAKIKTGLVCFLADSLYVYPKLIDDVI